MNADPPPETDSLDAVAAASAPTLSDVMPQRLGDYRIVREVGRGGMGVVYEAVQESLGRHVALKVLAGKFAQEPTHLERFRREARAAAKLHHTNIVGIYGVGENEGTFYYAMQFIQGQTLSVVLEEVQRLRKGGVALPDADAMTTTMVYNAARNLALGSAVSDLAFAYKTDSSDSLQIVGSSRPSLHEESDAAYYRRVALLGVQAADALAHAHERGILHRDIKPSNLMLDTDGTLWITDFGLAKAMDSGDLTQTGDIVGTIRYMAPERFDGKADARSDVYALGVTLYELLALQPPFTETDRAALIGRVTRDVPLPLRDQAPRVPRDLDTIVNKAMARDPEARYASAADLADDLRHFLEGRPIKARRSSALERFGRWCRRNKAIAALTLAVLVLLACHAASLVFTFWPR